MALWLFRHKSRRKRPRTTTPSSADRLGDDGQHPAQQPRSEATPEAAVINAPVCQPSSKKSKTYHEPNKLHRRARYSFESGRSDTLQIDNSKNTHRRAKRNPASTPSPPNAGDAVGYYGRSRGHYDGEFSGEIIFDRTPTLHHPSKRDGQRLLSRTGKQRKNAHDREREAAIKAMSNSSFVNHGSVSHHNNTLPLRPAAEPGSTGRPVKKHSLRHRGSIVGHHGGSDHERRHSDVSLPPMESIDSAMSSDSEQVAYTVSALDSLAPKPTLRYAAHPRTGQANSHHAFAPQRLPSQRRKLSDPIPEATLKAHKRVDDLADDLNASDLRELMERDTRRRERKRLREQERAQRRLARQAERLRQEAEAADGEPVAGPSESPSLARGVMGREVVGLGINTTSAIVTSSKRRQTPPPSSALPSPPPSHDSPEPHQPRQHLEHEHLDVQHHEPQQARSSRSSASMVIVDADCMDIDSDNNAGAANNTNSRRLSPIDMFHRTNSIPAAEDYEPQVPTVAEADASDGPSSGVHKESTPAPQRHDSRLKRLVNLRSMRSVSSSIDKQSDSVSRKPSDSSSSRAPLTWASLGALFRLGVKHKRSSGPSTFSNLSRDSILAAQAQAHSRSQSQSQSYGPLQQSTGGLPFAPAGPGAHPMKVQSTVPKRTLSRFREDLPDFLASPPDSRSHTPEDDVAREQPVVHDEDEDDYDHVDRDSIIPTPTSMHRPQQHHQHSSQGGSSMGNSMSAGTRDTPTSWMNVDEPEDPSPEPPLSMSLASIDSEGSWLSGGLATKRRRSPQMHRSLDNVAQMHTEEAAHHHQHQHSQNSNESHRSHEQRLTPVSVAISSVIGGGLSTSSSADEDVAGIVADDEYLNRRFAGHHMSTGSNFTANRESTGEIRASSDEEDGARWGSITSRKVATIVPRHTSKLVKSREGLMKTYLEGEDGSGLGGDDSPISETSPISQDSSEFKFEEAGVQRATSVNLGKGHVRHISAGSAKLLEISPHNSVDAKSQPLV